MLQGPDAGECQAGARGEPEPAGADQREGPEGHRPTPGTRQGR